MSYKIEIVEDDEHIRLLYKAKFEHAGNTVITAKDGAEGFELAKKHRPDLILLDIKMPRLPGHEMLKKVRSEDWGQDIKVVVLTNISKSEAPADFRFLNIEDYIVKVHYTPSQVLAIVDKILTSK